MKLSGKIYREVTPEIERFAAQAKKADHIDSELYTKYNVKRGLRDLEGHGVLAGQIGRASCRERVSSPV